MRLLVCGGTKFKNRECLYKCLDALHADIRISCIIHGAARGADAMAGEWALSRGVEVESYPVSNEEWSTFGKHAGPNRNQRMLREGRVGAVLAVNGETGTNDMVRRSKEAGVTVIDLRRLS